MWSPNGKVWSPEMKNVQSKILQSRSVIMIGASPTFRSKGDVYMQIPPPPHFWSQYLHFMVFLSHFLKHFLARYARSIACNRRN